MRPPQRILLVVTGLSVGGAERQLVALAHQLQKLGAHVAVAALLEIGPLREDLARTGISVHSLGMKRGVPGPGAIFRLAKIVRREKPDVVHAHMFHANILARVSHIFWTHIALVCTIHNVNEASSHSTNWQAVTWREKAYRYTNFLAQKSTAICAAAVERYQAVGAFRSDNLSKVPNGIVISKFARDPGAGARLRSELGLEGKLIGVMVARMEPPKDHALLLRAAAAAIPKNPSLHFVFVGDGPESPRLKELANSLGVSANVSFMGIRKDVGAFLSMADFFLLITAMEGLPLVILEAAAASLPMIVSKVGGIPEAVVEGKTGYLVGVGNINELTAAIEKISRLSPTERSAMGAAARDMVARDYDLDVVTAKYIEVYADAIKAAGQ